MIATLLAFSSTMARMPLLVLSNFVSPPVRVMVSCGCDALWAGSLSSVGNCGANTPSCVTLTRSMSGVMAVTLID